MSIENIKVSWFKSTKQIEAQDAQPIANFINSIERGDYADVVNRIRAGESSWKTTLPTIAFQGVFDGLRKKEKFIEASGLIILDIDDINPEEVEEYKQEIIDEFPSAYAAMRSPSGNGIKVLYYVQPDLVTADNYRVIGKKVVEDFEVYGDVDYLSITDTLIMTYDPKILINEEVIPAFVLVPDIDKSMKGELEPLDETKTLWDDAEDFFETVLSADIASKTNNNFHYIQVAVFDMKKFGFEHPKEDLSFIIDYAESEFKPSSENKNRFREVCEIAKQYPQTQWPYRYTQDNGEEDEEYVDYTAFMDDEDVKTKDLGEWRDADEDVDEEEESDDGLINYTNLFERVLETLKEGDRVGYEVSLKNLADIMRFRGTGILTITGIPGHGKTEFLDQITLDLARLYGHETIVAGFEQTPEEHIIKQSKRLIGKNIACPSWDSEANMIVFKQAYDFITNKIKHVDVMKTGGSINAILEAMARRIKESRESGGDPKWVIIDPFNMLSIKGRLSGHEKIEEILRRITHFSHQMKVMVFLVAHPFKMRKDEKTGEYDVPDFYSVKGSSAFFEMSYHGLVVYRKGGYTTEVMVKVLKVKQSNLGVSGAEAHFEFSRMSGRYIPMDEEGNTLAGDYMDDDWLEKAINLNKESNE